MTTGTSGSSTALLEEVQGYVNEIKEATATLESALNEYKTANADAFKGDGSEELNNLWTKVTEYVGTVQTNVIDANITSMLNAMITATDNTAGGIRKAVGG